MQNERDQLVLLYRSRLLTRKKIREILNKDASLKTLLTNKPSYISLTYKIPIKIAKQISQLKQNTQIQTKINDDDKKMHVLTIFDKAYPENLKNIPDPPLVIYGVGDISLLNYQPSISVIGTRQPSLHGEKISERIIRPLLDKKWCIVSGLAKGIDGIAHRLALENDCPTIAVLGGGFSHIYPKENYHIFREIMKKGLVLSEYPHDLAPKKYQFPERNRIISGLTHGTLVIEAKERSGTFITVDQALEQGKEVYAVPGSPLNPQAYGCNLLIQQGAKLVQSAEDILEDKTQLTLKI